MLNKEKKTCPICGKEVGQIEIIFDEYGIPYKMYCGRLSCKKIALKGYRKNYRSDGY